MVDWGSDRDSRSERNRDEENADGDEDEKTGRYDKYIDRLLDLLSFV